MGRARLRPAPRWEPRFRSPLFGHHALGISTGRFRGAGHEIADLLLGPVGSQGTVLAVAAQLVQEPLGKG